jgi:hypothetical protein
MDRPKRRWPYVLIALAFACSLLGGYTLAYLSTVPVPQRNLSIIRTVAWEWQCSFFGPAAKFEASVTGHAICVEVYETRRRRSTPRACYAPWVP